MTNHIQIGDQTPRAYYDCDTDQSLFTYPFPIFEDADLEVYVDGTLVTTGYTITGAGLTEGGEVEFETPIPANTPVTLARRMAIKRTSDFLESGELRAKVLNDELDHLTAYIQQVDVAFDRALKLPITSDPNIDTVLAPPVENAVLVWNTEGTGFLNGPTVTEIYNAESYATAAGSAMDNAEEYANAASQSAMNADNAATAAITAAASNMYSSNEVKSADFTIAASDDGTQFLIDTSAGDVTVTLPEGASVTDGFRIALGKTTADNNAVIVSRSGTDTINGSTTWQFSSPHGQSVLTADTTPSPDAWYAAGVGVATPVGVSDLHDNARPYDIAFIGGFSQSMTAESMKVQTYGELVVPRDFTLTGEQLYIDTAPTGSATVFDIEKNGVSVYSSKPQVADGANVGTSGTLAMTAIAAGDRITFKCTQVGSTSSGAGVRFTLAGKLS